MAVEVLPAGPSAVLVEVADLESVLVLDAALRGLARGGGPPWDTVVDLVPAARTILVVSEGGDLERLAAAVRGVAAGLVPAAGLGAAPEAEAGARAGAVAGLEPDGEVVEVVVRYDGPDLGDVARITGLDEEEVVRAHTGTSWRVAFGGFAPGFAYLVGGDPRLRVPRLDSPRSSVPAGSVGLAGDFSGVYPRSSPGGWRLLGRTDVVLWDPDRDPPAILRPGATVRFVAGDG
ncbi:MAG TPA: allophanate hydrolase subunit 1 [Phycicoccus sp.]